MRSPGQFQEGSFRRIKNGKLVILIGKLKGETSTSTQAFRYPKEGWTESAARKHCEDHGGRFEPATKEAGRGE
jgi:hypothetical protein